MKKISLRPEDIIELEKLDAERRPVLNAATPPSEDLLRLAEGIAEGSDVWAYARRLEEQCRILGRENLMWQNEVVYWRGVAAENERLYRKEQRLIEWAAWICGVLGFAAGFSTHLIG